VLTSAEYVYRVRSRLIEEGWREADSSEGGIDCTQSLQNDLSLAECLRALLTPLVELDGKGGHGIEVARHFRYVDARSDHLHSGFENDNLSEERQCALKLALCMNAEEMLADGDGVFGNWSESREAIQEPHPPQVDVDDEEFTIARRCATNLALYILAELMLEDESSYEADCGIRDQG
jgi:hypothetical protein